ncbi:MAG: hypothetical protein J6N76_04490 [Lachnospiraceae bacterium]|nr:hypothetical protein [Lachnospiraceae bacterium]
MKTVIRYAIVGVIAASLILGYYFYLTRHTGSSSEEATETAQTTELSKVITKDFSRDYPATPREVIKWYNRIIKLYYDPGTSSDDLTILTRQAQMLFDDSLTDYNPIEAYEAAVRLDVNNYETRGRYIVSTDVCDTNDIIYKKVKGEEIAYVVAYYFVKDGSSYNSTYQKYALRQDEDENWKILGFEMCDADGDLIR